MKVQFFSAALCVILTGCANLQPVAKTEQQIPLTTYSHPGLVGEGGAVYLWPPYSSAALVDGKGNRCVIAASGAKTFDSSNEVGVKMAKLLDNIDGLDASGKSTLVEAFSKISAADSRAAFVDIALFHLCMLDQNGTFAEFKKRDDGTIEDHRFKANLIKEAFIQTIQAAQSLK